MKRILYVACGFDGGKSGISVYMRETLQRLAKDNSLTVVATAADRPLLPEHRNIRYHVLGACWNRPLMNMLYVLLLLPWRFRRRRYDFLLLPAANRRAPWFKRFFTVAVVHDLSQYHVEAKYDFFRMFYIRHLLPRAVRKADRVVAISDSTRSDLHKYWRIRDDRLSVNWNGCDLDTFTPRAQPGEKERVHRLLDVKGDYLLYLSRIEHPGKNHLRLLEAFATLPSELRERHTLVLAGSDWSGAEIVHARAEALECRDRIRFAGFIPDRELAALYRQAKLYVCPSLFEGFGLPVVEAFACGCVTAASSTSSLGEVAGDAALLFDPEDTGAIAEALRRGLSDVELRRELRRRGIARAARFDWDRHVQQLLETADSRYQRRNRLLGISYDNVDMPTALAEVAEAASRKKPGKFAFVNADCFNQGWHNAEYREVLGRFQHVYPDGSGVRIAGKLLHAPVRANVNGTDMLPLLAAMAEKRKYTVFLLGGRPGVAESVRRNLLELYPKLRLAGVRDGYSPEGMVEAVAQAAPDILLVGFGVPLQEIFIDRHFEEMHCGAALGVGGLFDFYSGRIPRAPKWMRKIGMEWVFRLLMEPCRLFRRYVFGNPVFLWRTLRYGEGNPEVDRSHLSPEMEELARLLLARAQGRQTRLPRKLRRWNLTIKTAYVVKRIFDIVITLAALLALSPFLLAVMIWIKLDSPGPLIYRQVRVGKNGKHFNFYKFRSMYIDADRRRAELAERNESKDGVIFKMKNDPRITRSGRFIRKFSIDEIPQLFNVLIGDMSLVGPRPPLPSEVAQYTLEDRKRLHVIPGITCIWQVSGRSDIPFKEQVELDKEYIKSQSAWRDFLILLKTIPAVLTGKGAY